MAKLLAPYLSVLVFWVWLHSAWLAILGYHAQILLWLWREHPRIGGRPGARLLALALLFILAGPVVYVLLPQIASVQVGEWMRRHGLSGVALLAILPYFGLVHPHLEELHWSPLRKRSPWAHASFAGYHVIVLSSLMPPVWLAAVFVVLICASWSWQLIESASGGLTVPIVAHILADAGIAIAALALASGSSG
jgi:hypothetical protein